jgi:hypothetical protein
VFVGRRLYRHGAPNGASAQSRNTDNSELDEQS